MYPRLAFNITWSRLLWAAFGAGGGAPATDTGHRVAALSVRTLFDALLAEAGLEAGAPVILSGINIANMAEIVRLNGFAPHPVDIRPATLLPKGEDVLDVQARTGARLCLVAHLFGAEGAVEGLETLRRRGVLVVEDLAQGFSAGRLNAPPAADVALFSFGPIKRRTALGGAVAVFRDPGLAARVRARIAAYPALSGGWLRARACKYLLLKALSQPWLYGPVFTGLSLMGGDPDVRIGKLARGFSGGDLLRAIRRRPPARLLHLMTKQAAGGGALTERRRICDAFLASLPAAFRAGAGARSHVHWLVPLVVPEPDTFIRALRRRGFDATRGATSLGALTGPDTLAAGLMEHIVYLPHPADMDERARTRLRAAVLQALA